MPEITSISNNTFTNRDEEATVTNEPSFPAVQVSSGYFVSAALYFAHVSRENSMTHSLSTVAILTLSILVHELGHKLAIQAFSGKKQPIHLGAMGGDVKLPEDRYFSTKQKVLIEMAGPIMTLFLAAISLATKSYFRNNISFVANTTFSLNKFLFLTHIAPLTFTDGGCLVVDAAEMIDPRNAKPYAYTINLIGCIAGLILIPGELNKLILLFWVLLTFSEIDQEQETSAAFHQAQKAFDRENITEAKRIFANIAKDQRLNATGLEASYMLALCYQKQKKPHAALNALTFYADHLHGEKKALYEKLQSKFIR